MFSALATSAVWASQLFIVKSPFLSVLLEAGLPLVVYTRGLYRIYLVG